MANVLVLVARRCVPVNYTVEDLTAIGTNKAKFDKGVSNLRIYADDDSTNVMSLINLILNPLRMNEYL